jgi:tryptophan-rich sensory protein
MTLAYSSPQGFAWKPAIVAAVLILATMALGQIVTTPNLPWYDNLTKPWFTPPNWVFAPIWTVLYAVMGYLFYRILRLADHTPGRNAAIMAFVALLIVNTLWSYAFFLAHSYVWGLVDIAAQVVALIATVVLFGRLDRYSPLGFIPVAMWVAFAAALNYEIMLMN